MCLPRTVLDLDGLLQETSRTFALAIPLLPEPTRRAVGLAYLLFRVADTLEDGVLWPRQVRLEALDALDGVLETGDWERSVELSARWTASPPLRHAGYVRLLSEWPQVLADVQQLSPVRARLILGHARRTTQGMREVVAAGDERGSLELSSLEDLKDYCYRVAGIVGELLTELFLVDAPQLEGEGGTLRLHTRAFGEGLQLVNILKDSAGDAREGRQYLPGGLPWADVLALARADLDAACLYIDALQRGGGPHGFVSFCGLSASLAFASLRRLEESGPGAKVGRGEVARVLAGVHGTLARGDWLDPRTLANVSPA